MYLEKIVSEVSRNPYGTLAKKLGISFNSYDPQAVRALEAGARAKYKVFEILGFKRNLLGKWKCPTGPISKEGIDSLLCSNGIPHALLNADELVAAEEIWLDGRDYISYKQVVGPNGEKAYVIKRVYKTPYDHSQGYESYGD